MKEEAPEWVTAVGVTSLVLLLVSLALIAAGGWTWFAKFLESAAPAWVQAVGSIVAIGVAVAVPARQQRRQAKDEKRRHWEGRLATARSCYLACDEAAQTMSYISRKLRDNVELPFRLRTERVADLLATLQTLVGKDIPPELLKDLLTIQRELSYTQMALKQLWAANSVSRKRADAAEARERRVSEALYGLTMRHQLHEWIQSENGSRVTNPKLDFSDMLE